MNQSEKRIYGELLSKYRYSVISCFLNFKLLRDGKPNIVTTVFWVYVQTLINLKREILLNQGFYF